MTTSKHLFSTKSRHSGKCLLYHLADQTHPSPFYFNTSSTLSFIPRIFIETFSHSLAWNIILGNGKENKSKAENSTVCCCLLGPHQLRAFETNSSGHKRYTSWRSIHPWLIHSIGSSPRLDYFISQASVHPLTHSLTSPVIFVIISICLLVLKISQNPARGADNIIRQVAKLSLTCFFAIYN